MRLLGVVGVLGASALIGQQAAADATGTASWKLVRGKHWQLVGSPGTRRAAETPVAAAVDGLVSQCAPGMVHVRGRMKLDLSDNPHGEMAVEELQKTTCVHWINRDFPERCAEFDRDRWLSISMQLPTRPMDFCIDEFEYPNQRGAYPLAMVAWHEATGLCSEQGKRLCDESEWTFACEGEEAMPYPYGYRRDPEACVVDAPWRAFNPTALSHRDSTAAAAEMARLWQALPSGARPGCRSSFGVYDLTGNVDEWTRSVRPGERPSILKGGYWGPVRTRCRPATRTHDENHVFYQQGFRCCSDSGLVGADASNDAPLPRELP